MRFDIVADAEQAAGMAGGQKKDVAVGMGHAHRCLALGEALRQKGISVRFFLPDPSLAKKMFPRLDAGFSSCNSWEDLWQEEAPKTAQKTTQELLDMLVVDSYRLTSLPTSVQQRYKNIACFHDDKPPPAFASVAICCDLAVKNFTRRSSCDHGFYGGQYFPFHDRFARFTATEKNDRLLLWLGGRETGENLMPLLAEDVLGAWCAEVVISPIVEPCAELRALAHVNCGEQVRLYNEATAMDRLLPQCAAYLGGAGVTACEAALLGLQLILCPVASNQLGNARALEQAGARVLHHPLQPDSVRAALRALKQERQPPLELATLGLDRKGAERLAQSLHAISRQ